MSKRDYAPSLLREATKILRDDFGFKRKDAKVAYRGVLEALIRTLIENGRVSLRSLGTFKLKNKKIIFKPSHVIKNLLEH